VSPNDKEAILVKSLRQAEEDALDTVG